MSRTAVNQIGVALIAGLCLLAGGCGMSSPLCHGPGCSWCFVCDDYDSNCGPKSYMPCYRLTCDWYRRKCDPSVCVSRTRFVADDYCRKCEPDTACLGSSPSPSCGTFAR